MAAASAVCRAGFRLCSGAWAERGPFAWKCLRSARLRSCFREWRHVEGKCSRLHPRPSRSTLAGVPWRFGSSRARSGVWGRGQAAPCKTWRVGSCTGTHEKWRISRKLWSCQLNRRVLDCQLYEWSGLQRRKKKEKKSKCSSLTIAFVRPQKTTKIAIAFIMMATVIRLGFGQFLTDRLLETPRKLWLGSWQRLPFIEQRVLKTWSIDFSTQTHLSKLVTQLYRECSASGNLHKDLHATERSCSNSLRCYVMVG